MLATFSQGLLKQLGLLPSQTLTFIWIAYKEIFFDFSFGPNIFVAVPSSRLPQLILNNVTRLHNKVSRLLH
jgi:hypothetical protein